MYMKNQRLCIIHGIGRDDVGLVDRITSPIAGENGNIIDLKQDVFNGLFTVFMVVDMSGSALSSEGTEALVARIQETTGLTLCVEKYTSTPRNPDKKNFLVVLIGADKPGIIGTVSGLLQKYGVNIEFSRMVAREGLFLMELLIDVQKSRLPDANLADAITAGMDEIGIKASVQTKDVFAKKKRAVVFHSRTSLLGGELIAELAAQCGIASADIQKTYGGKTAVESIAAASALLAGLPAEVLETIADKTGVSPDTVELVQTLKLMGYAVCFAGICPEALASAFRRRLGLDHAFGLLLPSDADSLELSGEKPSSLQDEALLAGYDEAILEAEGISAEELTVIAADEKGTLPGFAPVFDLRQILDFYNQKILSKDNILGLIGAFGIPGL